MHISTKNFMAPAHFISAAPRPEYSSDFERSIIASSNCPDGLSTGMRPSSARISIRKAIISRTCDGSKKFAIGVTQLGLHDVGDGRAGHERDRQEHHDEDRLGQKADHAGAARAHRPIRIGGIDRGESRKKATQGENEAAAQHVAHEGEEQRIARQNRDQQRDKDSAQ